MLTTADWLLGSNSQSAAGLSTLSDRMKRDYLLFSALSEWRHDIQILQITELLEICSQYTLKKSSRVDRCAFHSEKLLWYSVVSMIWDRLNLSSLIKNGQIILWFLFFFWVLSDSADHDASWILFLSWVLFHACTLPLFFHWCEEFPPSSTCASTLNQHGCNMYDMTASCFFNHEGFH